MTEKKYSRRKWIKLSLQMFSAPLLFLWYSATKRRMAFLGRKKIYLPGRIPPGITFLHDIILTRQVEQERVFSARCTHLGCTINHQQQDVMICPCHGSKFTLQGAVLNGPAGRPLTRLEIRREAVTGRRYVEIDQT